MISPKRLTDRDLQDLWDEIVAAWGRRLETSNHHMEYSNKSSGTRNGRDRRISAEHIQAVRREMMVRGFLSETPE